ncbi:MAG TPA: response regulator transcription factor [Jatrophihabitans sp.]|nr:response regulator transcription factor [Jatrophihabitans sp.]
MIRVVLVDDHRLVRVGIASMLSAAEDIEVVGEAADGAEAIELLATVDADVVLMDLSMPVLDGVEATRRVIAARPDSRVVVLTSFAEQKRVRDAVAAGAIGYVLKDCAPDELLAAVRAAAAGHTPLDPRVAAALLPAHGEPANPASELSERETQVLRLVAKGLANKQIARSLGIAERTVKVHLGSVFRRIGVTDRTSAALWAREHLPEQ